MQVTLSALLSKITEA